MIALVLILLAVCVWLWVVGALVMAVLFLSERPLIAGWRQVLIAAAWPVAVPVIFVVTLGSMWREGDQ